MKRFTQLYLHLYRTKWFSNSFQRKYYTMKEQSNAGLLNNTLKKTINARQNGSCMTNRTIQNIMNAIPPESNALSPMDTLNIFRSLSEITQTLESTSSIVQHKNFTILREAMKVSIPYFHSKEKFDALRSIQNLSIPPDDEIFNLMLSSLLDGVYNLSLNELMLFDAILISNQKNELIDELRTSLIDRFNAKMSQLPIDFSYFIKNRRMLQFIQRNQSDIIEEVFVNIRKCAVKIDIFTPYEAMDIIITLSSFGDQCEYFEAILDEAYNVWHTGEVSIEMVEIVLTLLASRKSTLNYELYKDPRLIEKCSQVAMEHGDMEKCFTIQRLLNRLKLNSKRFIDFLLNNLKNENSNNITTEFLQKCITVCIACQIGNYKPNLFEEYLAPTLANMNFHQQFDIKINWPKFALQLHHLGIYHKTLFDAILKQKTAFQSVDKRSVAALEIIEMEKVLRVPVGKSLEDLKRVVGENQIRFLVHSNFDAIIPIVFKMNVHSKHFASFRSSETESIHSYHSCNQNQCLVALVTSAQNIHSSRPDMVTITLDSDEWVRLLHIVNKQALIDEICKHVQNQKINKKLTISP